MMSMPDLRNKTVAIIGNAVGCVRPPADYTIAVSGGIKYAPDADMLVSIDAKCPDAYFDADTIAAFKAFACLYIVGVPTDDQRATYRTLIYENVGGVHFRNNGMSAIRIAAECGATKILLAGFDAERYDTINAAFGFKGLIAKGLPALISELAEKGVQVEYYVPVRVAKKRMFE